MTRLEGRKRSKLACQTCRELKRRCDGAHPCGTCVRFEYHCNYQVARRRRELDRNPGPTGDPAPAPTQATALPSLKSSLDDVASSTASSHAQARSVEANSCPAFVRSMALRLDPKRNPRMHSFAWNAFLGSRRTSHTPAVQSITDVVSQKRLQELAVTYLLKVDPVYGFIDREQVLQRIQQRWATRNATHVEDAILCGIGALGCLFSQVNADTAEVALVELARVLLEKTLSTAPSADIITAWLLRVIYLRIADTHYAAWMASCTVMHMIDAAGLNIEAPEEAMDPAPHQDISPELRKRIVSIAQHLNIWMSFDMGLTRVALPDTITTVPLVREGDFTSELIELLPFSIELDPQRKPTAFELEYALQVVLGRTHSSPPSVLAQCNLALCLCRRLRSMEVALTDSVLQQVLTLTSNGIRAVQAILTARSPWHQMTYVPFQIVCVLLAIDTVSSISQLRDAMQCLQDICAVYNTEATQEALRTARSLVLLHQRGKEMFASALSEILKSRPMSPVGDVTDNCPVLDDTAGMNNFSDQFFGLQYNDMDQLLSADFFWNITNNRF
ncbi:Zn2Cys6 transcriptional regulator [Trichoderma simmonsii]|uniref:Zn2Cys6 transcriptional regulator n=1 Tax=Trichoderma simmonsii TaxID=1491479 RepID=A0A8G0L671_9HYPO|nr:Zn2Cys6 transcriptional regulator [Trichoderma simmonsii]